MQAGHSLHPPIHVGIISAPVVCSATDTIHTRCDVTVPDVSVFRARSQFCFNQVTDYAKQVTALHPPIDLGSSVPGCPALPLTQSIQGVMSLYLMSVYSVQEVNFGESGD